MPDEIDISNGESVGERLLTLVRAVGAPTSPVIIDLTKTTFCDASAIRMLLRTYREAAPRGCRVCAAVTPGGSVRRVFEITGADRHIITADDVGSAVALAMVAAIEESLDPAPVTHPSFDCP